MTAFDVVVIGGGGAGAAAAIAARKAGARVALLSKEPAGYGDTRIAEGGFTYPGRAAGDSPDLFFEDIMKSGEYLSDPKIARAMAEDAEAAIRALESFGYIIRRDETGQVGPKMAKRAGGHSVNRTVNSSGRGVHMGVVLRAACARAGVEVFEDQMAWRILRENGRVQGVGAYHLTTGAWKVFQAPAVALATGGTGWLYYPHTDCVRTTTGDGYALALDAGAELIEMEQVQFLPFAFSNPMHMLGIFCMESSHAGPYARLLDNKGELVAEQINRLTRAQVTRIVASALREGRGGPHGGLFLDLSPNLAHEDGRAVRDLLFSQGGFTATRRAQGMKAYRWEEPIEILPSAHYHMGGVRTDENGASKVPGLYAAGAVQGGLHGANRLGSSALTEIIVFGQRAGTAAAQYARTAQRAPEAVFDAPASIMPGTQGRHAPIALVRRLQKIMWDHVGPLRDAAGLQSGLKALNQVSEDAKDIKIASGAGCNNDMRDALELALMLPTAYAMAQAALLRQESRGAHLRDDFPEMESTLYHTLSAMPEPGQVKTTRAEIAA